RVGWTGSRCRSADHLQLQIGEDNDSSEWAERTQRGGTRERSEAVRLPQKWTRREILKLSAASATAVGLGGLGYGFAVGDHVEVSRVEVKIAHLPAAFDGLTIAQLSDIHHGPYTGLDYIRRCVEIANGLNADLIALTGDFTFGGRKYVEPC